jgi:Cu-Zn family superoxide dismutase
MKKAAVAALAVLLLLVTAAPATAASRLVVAGGRFGSGDGAFTYDAALVPASARAVVLAVYPRSGRTAVVMSVRGLLPDHDYGAHVHNNACGPAGTDAGSHFQNAVDPVQPSVDPAFANPRNEIWLDFTTDRRGNAIAFAVQDFQFGARRPDSVVIHAMHTHTGAGEAGTAGARLACLTVGF